jgi:RimJ/RimL family protein N-acetyltransferase
MTPILETERLILREFTTDDADFIVQLVNSPGWLQYIGDRNIKTAEQAKDYLQNGPLKSYALNGFGLSMVELKENGKPIGMCGIIKRDYLECPDIGFAFLPEFTGQGLAFEIASATMEYSRSVLHLPTIQAITVPQNKPSIRLLEKIGMRHIKKFYPPEGKEELLLFSNEKTSSKIIPVS